MPFDGHTHPSEVSLNLKLVENNLPSFTLRRLWEDYGPEKSQNGTLRFGSMYEVNTPQTHLF